MTSGKDRFAIKWTKKGLSKYMPESVVSKLISQKSQRSVYNDLDFF